MTVPFLIEALGVPLPPPQPPPPWGPCQYPVGLLGAALAKASRAADRSNMVSKCETIKSCWEHKGLTAGLERASFLYLHLVPRPLLADVVLYVGIM